MPKRQIRLIHWNAGEACERADLLTAAGYQVDCGHFNGPSSLRAMREQPPDAVVIDLERAPSQGRDVGLAVRSSGATRKVPLVFVAGARDKVDRLRSILPDAVFTTWSRIRSALKQAIANPPADPVKPESLMQGYSGTPLPKKLGIQAGMTVGLVGAPKGFAASLGSLPENVKIGRLGQGDADLIVWFNKSRKDLVAGLPRILAALGTGGVWIAWPKRASGLKTDLTQTDVRRTGLDAGLVDYKICAIDPTWSGLKFTRRKTQRS
jgi:CheY-like chemotaxis protein